MGDHIHGSAEKAKRKQSPAQIKQQELMKKLAPMAKENAKKNGTKYIVEMSKLMKQHSAKKTTTGGGPRKRARSSSPKRKPVRRAPAKKTTTRKPAAKKTAKRKSAKRR